MPNSEIISAVVDAYLERLGAQREPPSAGALRRLHRAHVERVPYETVWIHTGLRYTCSATESLARIASTSQGGYCFHLNGAFSELLAALGYDVVRHVGGVHGPDGPSEDAMTNHLVLTVHGLRTVTTRTASGMSTSASATPSTTRCRSARASTTSRRSRSSWHRHRTA